MVFFEILLIRESACLKNNIFCFSPRKFEYLHKTHAKIQKKQKKFAIYEETWDKVKGYFDCFDVELIFVFQAFETFLD